jgi:hypothetical protein
LRPSRIDVQGKSAGGIGGHRWDFLCPGQIGVPRLGRLGTIDVVPEGISGRGQRIGAVVDRVQKRQQILTISRTEHRLNSCACHHP